MAKLERYNGALLILGERKIASLSESREPRRALDDAWDDTLAYCLEDGYWNFAMRAVQIDSSASVTPTFGYNYAFTKPGDFVRLYQQSQYPQLNPPLFEITDEPNYWYANCDPLYVKYVSNDSAYGGDQSIWPQSFANYVEIRLALRTCKRITGAFPNDGLIAAEKKARLNARGKDAMNEPPGFPPTGTWVRARGGGFNTRTRRDESFN